jgi:hypothetical protein
MSDEKRATLKKVILAAMSAGALGRIPAHAATLHKTGSTQASHATAPSGALALNLSALDTFHDVFNNANPWVQTFGDLFVQDDPFTEVSCW